MPSQLPHAIGRGEIVVSPSGFGGSTAHGKFLSRELNQYLD